MANHKHATDVAAEEAQPQPTDPQPADGTTGTTKSPARVRPHDDTHPLRKHPRADTNGHTTPDGDEPTAPHTTTSPDDAPAEADPTDDTTTPVPQRTASAAPGTRILSDTESAAAAQRLSTAADDDDTHATADDPSAAETTTPDDAEHDDLDAIEEAVTDRLPDIVLASEAADDAEETTRVSSLRRNDDPTAPLRHGRTTQPTAEPADDTASDSDDEPGAYTPDDAPAEAAHGDDLLAASRAVTAPFEPMQHLPPLSGAGDSTDDFDNTSILDTSRLKQAAVGGTRSERGLAYAARRDIGRVRNSNQDNVLAMLMTLPRDGIELPIGLFVVADGMGGHDSGEVASHLAVRTIFYEIADRLLIQALYDELPEAIQALMVNAMQQANHAIWEHAREIGSDMGTTCTAALLIGQSLYIAHVGDSRAYAHEASGLRQLTSDHSTVGRLIELGHLDPSAAHDHPLRNQLYRTIGQQPQVSVDFLSEATAGVSHLLLCSDGLWGMVSDVEMSDILQQHAWPHTACLELISQANAAGGEDNISAIVVSLPRAEEHH